MDGSDKPSSSEPEDDVYFSSVIDEKDIERIKRDSEIEMDSTLIPPFMGQTYNQLILTYVIGIIIQSIVYFSIPFFLGIEEPFLSEPGGEALQMRRRVATISSVVVGIYFIISTIRARGTPALNYIYIVVSPLVLWMLHTPFIGSEAVFGNPNSMAGLRDSTRMVSVFIYIYLPYYLLFKLFKYSVELWIRIDEDNLRRAIEWEEDHLDHAYFSGREMAKELDKEKQ